MNTRRWKVGRAAILAGLLSLPVAAPLLHAADRPSPSGVVPAEWHTIPGVPGGTAYAYAPPADCYYGDQYGPAYGGANPYSWNGSRAANVLGWHFVYGEARARTNFMNFLGFNKPAGYWKWEHEAVYAADPNYYDPRDAQVYSAEGYGIPVAVPLAPVVKQQMNYGWGVPSSRMTTVGATYQRYNPGSHGATAAGGGYPTYQGRAPTAVGAPPTVYTPTDTTQQGFYYNHVPAWQPVQRARWTELQAPPAAACPVVVAPATRPAAAAAPTVAPPSAAPAVAPPSGVEVPEPAAK